MVVNVFMENLNTAILKYCDLIILFWALYLHMKLDGKKDWSTSRQSSEV